MATAAPSSTPRRHRTSIPLPLAEALVGTALSAMKSGSLSILLNQRPQTLRWIARRHLRPLRGVAGEILQGDNDGADAVRMLLRWAVSQLRPDRMPSLDGIDAEAWLDRTSWRPMLSVACHYGLLTAPDFPARYRRRPEEAAVDNLCGLWNVGSSTFYRYLDKGKRLVVELLLEAPLTGTHSLAQRRFAHQHVARMLVALDEDSRRAWHARQMDGAIAHRDYCSALWHAIKAVDAAAFVDVLHRFRIELANDVETDCLIDLFQSEGRNPQELFDLHLACAAIHLTRNADERAHQAYEQALRIASAEGDKRLLGIVYGELGKFFEARDTDRMLSYLEEGAEFLRQAALAAAASGDTRVHEEYVAALQKIGWYYILRNDPRSRSVLETAQSMQSASSLSTQTLALLEQTWGEYWRRSGDLTRAVQHKLKALNMFERIGDTRQMLSTFNNLSIIYGEAKDHSRAIDYARRVLSMAQHVQIDPYILANTLLNLGANFYWLGQLDEAIEQYRQALAHSNAGNLKVIGHRARFNLAEAFYKKFQLSRDPEDERQGDAHAAEVLKAGATELDSFARDAAITLKADILGPHEGAIYQRLVPSEFAVHADEMAIVQRNRNALALPNPPRDHIRAHLAIANAYLAISTKEREAALELIRQHGLGDQFDAEIDALRKTFSRELTREKALMAQWKQKSYGVLTEERASSVLHQVLDTGSINKSGYAQLCQVGLATASKHLGTLAERGLLVQMGKGPSTRYVLP